MRPIDADLLIDLLEEEKAKDDYRGFWYTQVCGIIRLLESAPTVKVAERNKGEWIIDVPPSTSHGTIYTCPFCGHEEEFEPTNYCPNCGAKMKG